MSNISDFIFSSIKSKLPTVNWNIGSLIRELIATPIIAVTESAASALAEQVNATNVHRFTENPEDYSDEINQTFYDLGFQEIEAINSTGVVTIYTDTDDILPIFEGTMFHYGEHNVYTTTDVFPGLVNTDNDPRFVQLRKLGVNYYAFDIPVTSAFINVNLAEGVSISWDEAPSYVYNIKVSSAISGGVSSLSLKDKAETIKDYLAPDVIPLNDGITKILKNNLPNIVVDAKYDTNTDNVSYLCVKTKKSPSTYTREVAAYKISDNLYQLTYKEPGIMSVVEVFKDSDIVQIVSQNVKDNLVSMTISLNNDKDVEYVTVKLRGLEDLAEVQTFLDGYLAGAPCSIEVKAPEVFYLGCQFTYSGTLNSMDVMNLCENIQSYSLDEMPTDTKVASVIGKLDASLVNSVIFTLTDDAGSYYKYRSVAQAPSGVSGSYAIYTSVDRIKASNV